MSDAVRPFRHESIADEIPQSNFGSFSDLLQVVFISVAPPAEPRGEKKHFFVQILGGEKLLKFVEKCR